LRDDKAVSPKEYAQLPKEEQEQLKRDTEAVSKDLQQKMQSIPQEARRVREKIRDLDHDVSMFAVGGLIDQLIMKYKPLADVVAYLEDMQTDIVNNVEIFLKSPESDNPSLRAMHGGHAQGMAAQKSAAMQRYAINVIIDHTELEGAPVIFEDHPTLPYLIGRIEHVAEMGTLVTNFNLIRAGALHRANGGFLVLDAGKLLLQPFAWEGLKRALKSGEIRIQSLGEALSLVSTVSLEPQPIPLDVKIILLGDRMLYYLLQAYDPEFMDLFKGSTGIRRTACSLSGSWPRSAKRRISGRWTEPPPPACSRPAPVMPAMQRSFPQRFDTQQTSCAKPTSMQAAMVRTSSARQIYNRP
jgi:predicted ATP-dependent protease